MSIHSTIKSQRQRLGMTEQQLADRVGVTRAAVQQWEREGGTAPKRSKQTAVADALGISVLDLMGIEAATQSPEKSQGDSSAPAASRLLDKLNALDIYDLSKEALLLAKHFDMLKNDKDRSVVYIDSLNLIMKTLSDSLTPEAAPPDSESNPLLYRSVPVEKQPV